MLSKRKTNKENKYNRRDSVIVNYVRKWNEIHEYSTIGDWEFVYHTYRIRSIFEKWIFSKSPNLVFDLNFLLQDLSDDLRSLKWHLKRLDNEAKQDAIKHNLPEINDLRPGSETYGFDNIYNDLMYISDRWMCQFRLRWLIDVIGLNHSFKEI